MWKLAALAALVMGIAFASSSTPDADIMLHAEARVAQRVEAQALVAEDDNPPVLVSTPAPPPPRIARKCGRRNITCSVHGVCVRKHPGTNQTYCRCDHGFRGDGCSEKYYFEKTLSGTRNGTHGFRYKLHTEDSNILGRRIPGVTANHCMLRCEQEMEFPCYGLVYFPSRNATRQGDCFLVDQRIVVEAERPCSSYTRGPEDCFFDDGLGYRGSVNVSRAGHECQSWSAMWPNVHSRTSDNYPGAGLEGNYCRNPDGEDAPWCYTIGGDRWEYCDIPRCKVPAPAPTPIPTCPPKCPQFGTCELDANGNETGVCVCFPGRAPGPNGDCSADAPCPNGCSGHGNCSLGKCSCDARWQGAADCSVASKPCPHMCSGHGYCDGYTGLCTCAPGWNGTACRQELFPCPSNCTGHGTCNAANRSCNCYNSYEGQDCSILICDSACNLHGDCDHSTRTCQCHPGYMGSACESTVPRTCPNSCSGNGQCVNGRCFCDHGWMLANCSKWVVGSCVNDCNKHGVCDDGVCTCDKHYSGRWCETFTMPHYSPWPLLAVVIPIFLVVAFIFWVGKVCHQVDVADGRSDFSELPCIRWFTREKERRYRIEAGQLDGSRFKKSYYTRA